MAELLADGLVREINQATDLCHRIVLLVAPAGAGKTAALRAVYERTAAPLVNVNLGLSRRSWLGSNCAGRTAITHTIIAAAQCIPENVLQEDPKLLMWYDQVLTRTGGV